jgi:hypothetical protein
MHPSIHYYALSLSNRTSRLFEGFRDELIHIQDSNFPFEITEDADNPAPPGARMREFFHLTQQRFDHYYRQDPLRLVMIGVKRNLAVFEALTTHQDDLIGVVEGDYTTTSPHDLGKIVWPVVKENIAGANKNAMMDLAKAANAKCIVSGIEAVGRSAETATGSILYVEEDYHVKGSIHRTDHSLILSKHVNLWEVIDDVVDVIIENVLKTGGSVIFLNSGSLIKHERIALIPCRTSSIGLTH